MKKRKFNSGYDSESYYSAPLRCLKCASNLVKAGRLKLVRIKYWKSEPFFGKREYRGEEKIMIGATLPTSSDFNIKAMRTVHHAYKRIFDAFLFSEDIIEVTLEYV